jgi:alpha-N-acetylglucosamine transferase
MKVYITLLSTNEYLDGVLALEQSLKNVGAKYPLVVAVTSNILPFAREILQKKKIEVIEVVDHSYTEECKKKFRNFGTPHWFYTVAKLRIFGLTQFEKMIFLDADMFLLKNIDHLFDRPHMTAAIDSPMIMENDIEQHYNLNSGLLVIVPDKKLEQDLIEMSATECLADQDLLRKYYPDWREHKELQLSVNYNFFARFWDRYRIKGIAPTDLYALHFVGKEKPFMKNELNNTTVKNMLQYFEGLYINAIRASIREIDD